MQKFIVFFIASLFFISLNSYAESLSTKHIVVVPHCLMHHSAIPHKRLAETQHLRLLEVEDQGIDALNDAKLRFSRSTTPCGGFMDVSGAWREFQAAGSDKARAKAFLSKYEYDPRKNPVMTYSIRYPKQVNQLLNLLNPQRMWDRLVLMIAEFSDRSATTWKGVNVASEIKAEIESLARANNRNDVSAFFVSSVDYIQPSVVVKIGDSNLPGVVIGGHMDTFSPNRPGADDDGTGTATVLELAKVLLSSGMKFNKPIYLVWYAAEERGLVGSQWVVKEFKRRNIPVSEVMQLDMTGYAYQNDLTMWLMDDYVNTSLTSFLETLINTYVKTPVQHSRCGYACSDHASWTQGGYASCIPFESSMSTYNPYIHTANDTMEKLSLAHMTHYAQLAIAFAVELAEPVS